MVNDCYTHLSMIFPSSNSQWGPSFPSEDTGVSVNSAKLSTVCATVFVSVDVYSIWGWPIIID
jgi:hypothetical protein